MKKFYIELDSACPVKCRVCHKHKVAKKSENNLLSLEEIKKAIDKFHIHDFQCIRITGCEPALNEHFEEITNRIHYMKMKKYINTTLAFCDLELMSPLMFFDEVSVNLASVNEEYAEFYGKDLFHVVDKNLRLLLSVSSGKIVLHYVVSYDNSVNHLLLQFYAYVCSLHNKEKLQISFFPAIDCTGKMWEEKITRAKTNFAVENVKDLFLKRGINAKWVPNFGGERRQACSIGRKFYMDKYGDIYPCPNVAGEYGFPVKGKMALGRFGQSKFAEIIRGRTLNFNCKNCTPERWDFRQSEFV